MKYNLTANIKHINSIKMLLAILKETKDEIKWLYQTDTDEDDKVNNRCDIMIGMKKNGTVLLNISEPEFELLLKEIRRYSSKSFMGVYEELEI